MDPFGSPSSTSSNFLPEALNLTNHENLSTLNRTFLSCTGGMIRSTNFTVPRMQWDFELPSRLLTPLQAGLKARTFIGARRPMA